MLLVPPRVYHSRNPNSKLRHSLKII